MAAGIEIRDGVVVELREYGRVDSKVFAEALMRDLQSGIKTVSQTPALPSGCRFYVETRSMSFFIIEMRPGVYPLYFRKNAYRDPRNVSYVVPPVLNLAMPWQYFVLSFSPLIRPTHKGKYGFHQLQIFWAQNRLMSLEEPCYTAFLPNIIPGSTAICQGSTIPVSENKIPGAAQVEYTIEQVTSQFYTPAVLSNFDYKWNYPYSSIKKWEEDSKESMMCWKNWKVEEKYPTHSLKYWLDLENSRATSSEDALARFKRVMREVSTPKW